MSISIFTKLDEGILKRLEDETTIRWFTGKLPSELEFPQAPNNCLCFNRHMASLYLVDRGEGQEVSQREFLERIKDFYPKTDKTALHSYKGRRYQQ